MRWESKNTQIPAHGYSDSRAYITFTNKEKDKRLMIIMSNEWLDRYLDIPTTGIYY